MLLQVSRRKVRQQFPSHFWLCILYSRFAGDAEKYFQSDVLVVTNYLSAFCCLYKALKTFTYFIIKDLIQTDVVFKGCAYGFHRQIWTCFACSPHRHEWTLWRAKLQLSTFHITSQPAGLKDRQEKLSTAWKTQMRFNCAMRPGLPTKHHQHSS